MRPVQLQITKLCTLAILLALPACRGAGSPTPGDMATRAAVQTATATPLAADETTLTPAPMNTATVTLAATDTRTSTPTARSTATALPLSTATEAPPALILERIGQVGGVSKTVAVQNHYAYLSVGPRLVILDITDPAKPSVVGQSSPLPGFENLVVTGNYAYVAAGEGGLRVVDISDPAAPAEVGSFATPGPAWSVATAENTAYVAAWDGLHILDISDALAPTAIGFFSTPDAILDLAVVGDIAYLAEAFSPVDSPVERGGLRLVDIADPAHPEEIGFYPMNPLHADEFEEPDAPRGVQNVTVVGDRAYLTYRTEQQGGLRVVDISGPANPEQIGDYQDYIYYVSDVAVVAGPSTDAEQTYAYVGTGVNAGLLVLDLSDPAEPNVLVDEVPGWARGMAVAGDTLYIADEAGGLHIADISDPSHPIEVGSYGTLGDARGVAVSGDRAYVTDGLRDLWVLDLSDPAQQSQAGVLTSTGSIQDVVESGSLAYLAAETEGLLVVDVSDPAHPTQITAYDTPGLAHGVDVAGDHVYVADGQLQVLDVTVPAAPAPLATYESSERVEDVIVAGEVAYLTNGGLDILDISDPTQPMEASAYATPGSIADMALTGNHAYLVVKGDLYIVDVCNPLEPFELSRLELAGMPEYGGRVAVAEDLVSVVGEQRLHVVDVSDPANPKEITSYDALDYAHDVAAAADYIYVADGANGLVILQLNNNRQARDLHALTRADGLPPGEIRNLWVAPDGKLWVATDVGITVHESEGWIQVYDGPVERLLGADANGRVWAVLESGTEVARYDASGTWRTYGPEQGWTALPPHEYLSPGYGDGLVTDRQGRVWWATGRDDVRRFDPESQSWSALGATDLGFEPPEDEDYQGHFLTDVVVLGHQVWVGDCVGMGEVYSGQGIRWTDGKDWHDIPFTEGQCVLDIEVDDAGRMWVGAFDGLLEYDPASNSWSRIPLPPWERRQLVVEIDLDGEGKPWVEVLRYGGASPFGEVGHYHLQDGAWVMDSEGWFRSLAFGADGVAVTCSEGAIIRLQDDQAEEVDRVPGSECQIAVDGAGRVWITNHDDLWWFEPES